MNAKTISAVMSEMARRSNKNLTKAQRDARRDNAKKARAARAKKNEKHTPKRTGHRHRDVIADLWEGHVRQLQSTYPKSESVNAKLLARIKALPTSDKYQVFSAERITEAFEYFREYNAATKQRQHEANEAWLHFAERLAILDARSNTWGHGRATV